MTARQPKNPTPIIPRTSGCAAPAGKMGIQGDLSERARVACFSASLFSRKEKTRSSAALPNRSSILPGVRNVQARSLQTLVMFVHSISKLHASGAGGACPAPTGRPCLLCRVEACLDRHLAPAARKKRPPKLLTAATIAHVDKSPALFPDGSGRARDNRAPN